MMNSNDFKLEAESSTFKNKVCNKTYNELPKCFLEISERGA